jgi:diguanylate cyclase
MEQSAEQNELAGRTQDEGRRFARRMYLLRTLGLALGAVCIGGALWQQGASQLAWAALIVNGLVWPHIAYRLAWGSPNSYRAELRNLMMDSASGGAWIAVIGLSPAPSAVIFAMMAMDKASVGGLRFLARCLAAQAAAAAVVALVLGFELHPLSSAVERLASLPLLVVYPIVIGLTTYRLARRVQRQNETLAALSSIDGLSRLLNRTHWEAVVASEFQRCRRIGHPSSVMMIDIDHFKAVNDRHGHPVGDEVIRKVAELLRGTLRLHDVPGRYGGEEFGVVLPGTAVQGAELLAERICARIESAVLEPRNAVRGTVSIGVAAFDTLDAGHMEWIARADRALYSAKESGRNRAARYAPAGTAAGG